MKNPSKTIKARNKIMINFCFSVDSSLNFFVFFYLLILEILIVIIINRGGGGTLERILVRLRILFRFLLGRKILRRFRFICLKIREKWCKNEGKWIVFSTIWESFCFCEEHFDLGLGDLEEQFKNFFLVSVNRGVNWDYKEEGYYTQTDRYHHKSSNIFVRWPIRKHFHI